MRFITQGPCTLSGELAVPGDKSISHRALMLGGLADGTTTVRHLLQADDVLATAAAMARLGVIIEKAGDEWRIHGQGGDALGSPSGDLDLGNSGTGMRLLAGLLAGQGISATLTGDDSLRSRPMARILEPLRAMGARIEAPGDRAPISLHSAPLSAIDFAPRISSAQVKSCILLAALGADGTTRVTEPAASRDHTESMLAAYGVVLQRDGLSVSLEGPQALRGPVHIEVPGDFSSAAFFLVAGSILPDSELTLLRVGVNPLRSGLLDVLLEMGADIQLENQRLVAGEPVADIRVRSAALRGIEVPEAVVPRMIDEFPVFFLAAALADGETQVSGASELRVKESDRIAVMARALNQLGARVEEQADGARIQGVKRLRGAVVDGALDHRCAMTLALAGLTTNSAVTVRGAANVATSYPDFAEDLGSLGGAIECRRE